MIKDITYFHSLLKPELDLTQKYIRTFSESKDSLANKSITHIIDNKGKMLRPMLLILTGKYTYKLNNEDKKNDIFFIEDITKAAAILEIIQMSSLIHDDVLDHSAVRRNKSTLNSLRGNRFAILMGDYLIAQSLKNCYQLVHHAERIFDSDIMYSFLESISKLVLGEIQQNNFNSIIEGTEEEIKTYFEIVENKTASLFSLACSVGSKIGGNELGLTESLNQVGQHIGIAYQIIDDLRDFAFSRQIAGEKNFQDIIFGIKTLPVILAKKVSQNGLQEKLLNRFNCRKEISEPDKLEISYILEKSGSFQTCLGEAKENFEKARAILNNLPMNEYSVLLQELIDYLSEIGDSVINDIRSVKLKIN
jgi:geranylgeranyl pyrophosphate synthase